MGTRTGVKNIVRNYVRTFDNSDGKGFCVHNVIAYVKGQFKDPSVISENSVYGALIAMVSEGEIDKMSLSYKCQALDKNHTFYFPNKNKLTEIQGVMVLSKSANISKVCIDALESKKNELEVQLSEIKAALIALRGVKT